jgi:hypothetical protein
MLEFEVTRDLPPPIGQLNDDEREWIVDTLAALRSGDVEPLEFALQAVLEARITEQEFSDFLLFDTDDRLAILQRVAEQIAELAGVRLEHVGE